MDQAVLSGVCNHHDVSYARSVGHQSGVVHVCCGSRCFADGVDPRHGIVILARLLAVKFNLTLQAV